MPSGRDVADWYARAYAHRLRRSQDFNNVEVNLMSFGLGGAVRHGVLSDSCGAGGCKEDGRTVGSAAVCSAVEWARMEE